MSKNNSPKHDNAEDYLAQVAWNNQQSQRQPDYPLPWYMEPKWKYKKISSSTALNKLYSKPAMIALVISCAGIGYLLYRYAFGFLIILLVVGAFIALAIYDASKRP